MKKFLSLALSLAMVFSMFTFLSVGASALDAKTYTDRNDIQYKEAVDVISALDIMGGYSSGTFGPTGNLTRGAATKIVCNLMVGPSTAEKLPAPSGDATIFFDVPSTHTFAATIAYCAENNFISGYSDGSFHPGDPLSGNAFLKMLLCALGYDQDIEKYRNTSAWATNVVSRAVEVGLMKELPDDFDGRTALTREQAALLAFNTLQSDMVEYENRSTGFVMEGSTITPVTTGGTAKVRTWSTSNTNAANIDATTNSQGYNIVQFAELKFNRLVKYDNTDDLGKPSTKWIWKGDEVGEYEDNLTLTYWEDKEIGDIYKDLGLTTDRVANFYVNGVPQYTSVNRIVDANNNVSYEYDYGIDIVKNRSTKLSLSVLRQSGAGNATKIGDGTRIDVYYDRDATYEVRNNDSNSNTSTRSTTAITICAVVNYAGKVSKVTRASGSDPRKITVEFAYDPYRTPTNTSQGTAEFETDLFAADDIVTYTYSGKTSKIVTVDKLTNRVEGGLTRYSKGNSVTIRGNQYGYSGMVAFDPSLLRIAAPNGTALPVVEYVNDSDYSYTYRDDDGNNVTIGQYSYTYRNDDNVPITLTGKAALNRATLVHLNDDGDKSATLLSEILDTNTDYVVYANDRNQAMWVEEADLKDTDDGSSGYALIRWIESEYYDQKANNQARLLFSNATQRTVDLYKDYLKDWFGDSLDDGVGLEYKNYSEGEVKFIVHYNRDSDGSYKLTRYDATHNADNYSASNDFSVSSRKFVDWNLTVDSSTIFVVNDDGTYRRYVGRNNVPNVNTGSAGFAYLNNDGLAKYVWITDAAKVSTYSKDITFIAPASRSDEYVDGDGWEETYYTYNAVVAGEIKTIEISKFMNLNYDQLVLNDDALFPDRNGSSLWMPIGNIEGDNTNYSKAQWGVILNNTTKNTSGRYTAGYFDSSSISAERAHGIKTPLNGEVEVNTASGATKQTIDLLGSTSLINAYYVNKDGDITRLGSVYDIDGDSDAWVFYTLNDDNEITNIFVCENNP